MQKLGQFSSIFLLSESLPISKKQWVVRPPLWVLEMVQCMCLFSAQKLVLEDSALQPSFSSRTCSPVPPLDFCPLLIAIIYFWHFSLLFRQVWDFALISVCGVRVFLFIPSVSRQSFAYPVTCWFVAAHSPSQLTPGELSGGRHHLWLCRACEAEFTCS